MKIFAKLQKKCIIYKISKMKNLKRVKENMKNLQKWNISKFKKMKSLQKRKIFRNECSAKILKMRSLQKNVFVFSKYFWSLSEL